MSLNQLFVQKYQPQVFKDFESNNELFAMLKAFILMDQLNILFIGDMACGKTCLLNAIVREYYQGILKDYEENVLYINNLKEQGINYYRTEVKTFCQSCCSIKNKKKIIILDDIDLINEQSQQAFRNCIDKFSKNVIFISSCTNIQKVIESIQSRLNIIKINNLEKENMFRIIKKIKTHENIHIDPDAEQFIVAISNNTIKILLNYMEKFKLLNENITLDLAIKLCSNISFLTFENYTSLLKENRLFDAIQLLYDTYDKGFSVMDILDNFFFFIKTTSLLTDEEKYCIIPCICKYITVFSNIHEDEIELALFTNNIIHLIAKP
jgi:DNA polymerase III delta prime subunit